MEILEQFLCCGWCLIICDPMDCSPPGSSVHEILQARILEWFAISFSSWGWWEFTNSLVWVRETLLILDLDFIVLILRQA